MQIQKPRYEILLLDDDEDDYILLKAMLNTVFGDQVGLDWYQKDGVSNMMICSGEYAITMVDLMLGTDNGLKVIQNAKLECPEAVVFLFTGWMKEDVKELADRAGANGVIQKHDLSPNHLKSILLPFLPDLD